MINKYIAIFNGRTIGICCMITGAIGTIYGVSVIVRYLIYGDIKPLFLGNNPMAFSSAALFVFYGLAIFWLGWLMKEQHNNKQGRYTKLASYHIVQIILAIISSLTVIFVALIGAAQSRNK